MSTRPNEKKNTKLGQNGSCGGHVTLFWNLEFGTPLISEVHCRRIPNVAIPDLTERGYGVRHRGLVHRFFFLFRSLELLFHDNEIVSRSLKLVSRSLEIAISWQVSWKELTFFCGKFIRNSIYGKVYQNRASFTEDMTNHFGLLCIGTHYMYFNYHSVNDLNVLQSSIERSLGDFTTSWLQIFLGAR